MALGSGGPKIHQLRFTAFVKPHVIQRAPCACRTILRYIYIYLYIYVKVLYIYNYSIYILIGRNRNTHRRSQDILHNAVRMAMLVVKLKARTTPPDLFCISPGIKFVFVEKNDTPNPVVYLHFPKHIANLS